MKRWKKRWLRDNGWFPHDAKQHEWRRLDPDGIIALRPAMQRRGEGRWATWSALNGQITWSPLVFFDDIFPALAWAELNNWGRR